MHLLEKVKEQIDYLQIFFILFNLYARVFEERFIVFDDMGCYLLMLFLLPMYISRRMRNFILTFCR